MGAAFRIPKSDLNIFLLGMASFLIFIVLAGTAFAVYYAGTQQIVSTVATATAPLDIQSTTLVSNLNVDLLDDLDSASLIDAPNSWTCTLRSGSTSTGTGTRTSTATCSGNEKAVSGGCHHEYNNLPPDIKTSRPTDQGWECQTAAAGTTSTTAYANCCT